MSFAPGMEPILLVSCSVTRLATPKVRVEDLPTGLTMQQALDIWMQKLDAEVPSLTPRELYRGLGFQTLVKIQDQFKLSGVKIITGGQGLTDIDEKIVPYDFTASVKEPANIFQKVTAEPFVTSVWWRMINQARHKTSTPIADLVVQNPGKYVIISASKVFLRYAADDILSIPYDKRDKVRILLTASSLGSVPKQLRPMIIPFDRGFVNELPGNRNDSNHRAAQRYLELLQDEEFAEKSISQQILAFETEQEFDNNKGKARLQDIEEFLIERPHLLEGAIEDSYRAAQKSLGTLGGRMLFRSIVRKLKGSSISASGEDVEAAVDVLKELGLEFVGSGAPHVSEEEEALQGLQIFVDAVRQLAPKAVFTAADVCRWATAYYIKREQVIPSMLDSANKLSFVLKNNADILGLAADGKGYTIVTAPYDQEAVA